MRNRHLQRIGLLVAVVGIAILCLSSAWLAAAVGIATVAVVALDMLFTRSRSEPRERARPDKLSVDLSRRR
jgi:hypothetical protein